MSQSFEKFGNYILLEKIQTGGMAEIYLARKPGTSGVSRFVAIKRILPQFNEQHEFIEMFKDEAKIAVNLSHANIVSIHEFGLERNQFFLAMDYVEGRNLRQILNKMKKSGVSFSIEQVLYTIKEVAAGLDHAHRCIDANTGKPLNIIHRDMSPQNVMVSFEGEVKVVDFGIAKAETQLDTTRAGTLKGKFGYMSPEQAEGQNVDLRTDIFALGIVLWELLANDRLFVANNEVNTLRKVRDCQIPSLRKINPNIPPELERIVSKSLAKDRNLRYQTAAAFHRELSRFLNRQYPDFSPHDFSVFIKTLFAAEILESRKKMVEFSKIEVGPTSPPPIKNDRSENTTDRSQFTSNSTGTLTENTLNSAADFGDPAKKSEPRPSAQPATMRKPNFNNPNNAKPTVTLKGDGLSTANLAVDRSSYREREGVREGSYHSGGGSYGSRSTHTGMTIRKPSALSSLMPVFLIVAAIGVGGAAFYQTNPTLAYKVLANAGIVNTTEISSTSPTQPQQPQKMQYDVIVLSTPAGAEILINDKPSGEITPATLRLAEGLDAKITVRLPGHAPHEQMLKIDGNKSINVMLQGEKIGKIDVNVVGAGQIFIDGKLVAQGSPIVNWPVHADKDIVVRAEDPVTKAADEVKIRVAADTTKKITLIPRAFQKKPDAPQK